MKPFNVFPYDSNIHFMRLRWVSLAIAALMMFVALGAMFTKGFNLALDFTGGVGIELRFPKPPDVDELRNKLTRAGYEAAQVQTFGTGTDILVRLQDKPRAQATSADGHTTSVAQDVRQIVSTPENPAEVRS